MTLLDCAEYGLVYGGELHAAEMRPLIAPATGEPFAHVALRTQQHATLAVASTPAAQQGWASLTPGERAHRLLAFAATLEQAAERLAQLESTNAGKPLTDARAEIARVIMHAEIHIL
jgi:acyl-CoA reductase-like NAD-dependent aldehyde dehydrogenase